MKAVESVILFVFFIFFASCLDESIGSEILVTHRGYPNVDEALWAHFDAFEKAASDRGYDLDLSSMALHGNITNIQDENVAGSCSYGGRMNQRDVLIDLEFWNRSSHLYREYIIFHELGHCVLGQDHREACFTNRTWTSLMRSGLGSCRDNYKESTRSYYLDELFEVVLP
jgi:hypothetical protein